MNIVVVAGGTGGHFYPGLSVAKWLRSNGHTVSLIVRRGDFVIPLQEREGIPFETIFAGGFQRGRFFSNISLPIQLMLGFIKSIMILLKLAPHRVLVMGGYLSVPPAFASVFLRIPFVLHEQNYIPGLANRIIRFGAKKIALGFSNSNNALGAKIVVTGNPVREYLDKLPNQKEALAKWGLSHSKKTLLVFGGSLGAHFLNQLVPAMFSIDSSLKNTVQVIHFSGQKDEEEVMSSYRRLGLENYTASYGHEMDWAYAASDFIICRSGASTISELMVVKIPAILIPYPFATSDHQTFNAKTLSDIKASLLVQQNKLSPEYCAQLIRDNFLNLSMLIDMKKKFDSLSIDPRQADRKIAELVIGG